MIKFPATLPPKATLIAIGFLVGFLLSLTWSRHNNRPNASSTNHPPHSATVTPKPLTKIHTDRRLPEVILSKHNHMEDMIHQIRKLNADTCRDILRTSPPLHPSHLELVYERWIMLDPLSAFDHALEHQRESWESLSGGNPSNELSYVIRAWMRHDSEAALRHISERTRDPGLEHPGEAYVYTTEWSSIDAQAAHEWFTELRSPLINPSMSQAIKSMIVDKWSKQISSPSSE